jgi:Holliday junction resolvase RusA-like endonuclease
MAFDLDFTIPGKPMGKQRPRMTRTGHVFTSKETVAYENLVKLCFLEAYPYWTPTDAEVSMHIFADFPIPSSWSKKKKQAALEGKIHPRKPDWDNIGKIISDGLNSVAFKDDAQIYACNVMKRYAETPKVMVLIVIETG